MTDVGPQLYATRKGRCRVTGRPVGRYEGLEPASPRRATADRARLVDRSRAIEGRRAARVRKNACDSALGQADLGAGYAWARRDLGCRGPQHARGLPWACGRRRAGSGSRCPTCKPPPRLPAFPACRRHQAPPSRYSRCTDRYTSRYTGRYARNNRPLRGKSGKSIYRFIALFHRFISQGLAAHACHACLLRQVLQAADEL